MEAYSFNSYDTIKKSPVKFAIQHLNRSEIKEICQALVEDEIDELTIHPDQENFVFFCRKETIVFFVEGKQEQYARLRIQAREHLTNDYVVATTTSEGSALEEPVDQSVLIHKSILTPLTQIEKHFKNTQLYFNPFEAPGGDFYWGKNYDMHTLLIVGDCTGHGMQGAMISMSVITILKQLFKNHPIDLEDSIRDFYDEIDNVIERDNFSQFDCEIGAVLLDWEKGMLEYVGTGVNLAIRQQHKLQMYKSRKRAFLSGEQNAEKLMLAGSEELFLFTDGITDQFDSDNRKKLGRRKLAKLLREQPYPVTLQSMKAGLEEHRGSVKPVDDQTLLMVEIPAELWSK